MRREVTNRPARDHEPSAPAPLPARSVVLSLMLGAHPARWSPAQFTAAGTLFGVAASTMRTALTRAVAAGDLERHDGDYVLGERLVRRQARQDEAVRDAATPWDGAWETAIVVVTGRSGTERAALRDLLAAHRLAELREGVWMRPANLTRPRQYDDQPVLELLSAHPEGDPAQLAARLWDLTGWADTGRTLRARLTEQTDPGLRLAAAAALVRHLATDPLLPGALLPADWPGSDLRETYRAYVAELGALLPRER